ncbi:potassium translocating ATPase, subunit A [Nostocoides japonicum T1-X7]|uniref:Potassium-transporting ATPase potassium-binding subunit n=1 Tax=Nostocoides japonicum T1-X7 TaxID=1194083 RepID=A0A077LXP9_9MICO|nr:potassium-transporting ATPase subunit KdpA [Tetrasphaera japonica]CCH76695.1 potassium translocating ATPase, subunit A [Tetrasphaera japonica T1-X7]
MSDAAAGLLTIGVVVALLAITHVPLGNWMARVFTDETDWRVERTVYRAVGVDPRNEQTWRSYAASVLAFSGVSLVVLFLLIVLQKHLPLAQGTDGMGLTTAVNTAISFVTNTNWQSYAGEVGTGPLVQTVGLAVQNFVSAAVGLAVAIVVIRGVSRRSATTLGNFWVDLVRGVTRILLPISLVAAVLLVAGGVIQNLASPETIAGLAGHDQVIRGGLVASQEAIKELGTNGGGYFNANSAHPFENPNPVTNLVEILLMLVVPFALPRTFGVMVGDRRQGWTLLGFAATLWAAGVALVTWAEVHAAVAATGSMEGKEVRFGVWGSALFGATSTGTSTGAVNSMHESYSPLGGGVLLVNMALGEISPGGVGSGLYGIVVIAVLTVFLAGLMVGRTPEYLGKRIGRPEITMAALYAVVTPTLALAGAAAAVAYPTARESMLASGPHGLTEVLYAYTSAANNNGSAFAGLSADTPWFNLTLGAGMLLGRFLPMLLVLALAGRLAAQSRRPVTAGTMPTHTPLFLGLLVGVAIIVAGLTYFPAIALGPIAEALS